MASWILVPCLVELRSEFNTVSPSRDKGADGSIGDTSHAGSSSDHNPDETGNTPSEDADNVNEVHAVDVDSTGEWPDGKGGEEGGWFDRKVRAIAAREREEYNSTTIYGRLQNIIWRGKIISRSWGWSEWRMYTGASKHFDHAHFSARYLTNTEADTRPWGVVEEDDVSAADVIAALKSAEGKAAIYAALNQDKVQKYTTDPASLAQKVWPASAEDNGFMSWASALSFAHKDLGFLKALLAKTDDKADALLVLVKAQATALSALAQEADQDDVAADQQRAAIMQRLEEAIAKVGDVPSKSAEEVLAGLAATGSDSDVAQLLTAIYGAQRAANIGDLLVARA